MTFRRRREACTPVSPVRYMCFLQDYGENLEDASNELILCDDEEVRYMCGEVFVHTEKDDVESMLDGLKEKTNQEVEKLQEEREKLIAKMAELKAILYGKFKDAINLEED